MVNWAICGYLYTKIEQIPWWCNLTHWVNWQGMTLTLKPSMCSMIEIMSVVGPQEERIQLLFGVKMAKRKSKLRHFTASIQETYLFFCEEHPDLQVGNSKFAEYRHKHVLLTKKLTHNVRLCKHHENAIYAFSALYKAHQKFSAYSQDLPAKMGQDWINPTLLRDPSAHLTLPL